VYRRTSRPTKRTSRSRRNGLFTTGPVGERLVFDMQMDTARSPGMKRYSRDQYVRHLWQEATSYLKTAEGQLDAAERDSTRRDARGAEHARLSWQRNVLSWVLASERMAGEAHALARLTNERGEVYRGGAALDREWWTTYKKLAKRWPVLPQD